MTISHFKSIIPLAVATVSVAAATPAPAEPRLEGERHSDLASLATPLTFTCKLQGIYLTRSIDVSSASSATRRTDSTSVDRTTASHTFEHTTDISLFGTSGVQSEQRNQNTSQLSAKGGLGLKWGIIPEAEVALKGDASHVASSDFRRNHEQGTTRKTGNADTASRSSETTRSDSMAIGQTETDETKRGGYRLHFSVLLKNTDTTDTVCIDLSKVKVMLTDPDLPGVLTVSYHGKGEVRLGAESTVFDFDEEISDESQLRSLLRLQNNGELTRLRLMVSGATFPAISEKTGENILSEQSKKERRRPGPRIAVEFDELQELSPWRISGRHTAESGSLGTPVTLREALQAVGGAASKQMDSLPSMVFSFSKDGSLRQIIDTPLLEETGSEEYRMIALRLTREKNGETRTEVRLPLSPILDRSIVDYSEIALIDFSFSELAEVAVLEPEFFASLRADLEEYLAKTDKTALSLWKKQISESQRIADESPLPAATETIAAVDVERYRRRAQAGVPNMQFKLAECLRHGYGVAKDEEQAAEWYLKAAEQGHAGAQNALSICYWTGKGVPSNLESALEWMRKAAEQGHAEAQFNMGLQYLQGIVMEKDVAIALDWLRKSAQQNVSNQMFLAELYFNGELGVEKDLDEAARWCLEAAKQDYPPAIFGCGRCLEEGVTGIKNPTGAFSLYLEAAKRGYAEAQVKVGECYWNGTGVKKDKKQAVIWWQKAAEQGNVHAQVRLYMCYRDGDGVEKNLSKYQEMLRKVAEQGDDTTTRCMVQTELGNLYLYGLNGVDKDEKEAVKWFREAADHGFSEAQRQLGNCYYKGTGVEQNITKAVEWYRKAAEQGHAEAQFNLGLCYFEGRGVEKDDAKAVEWFSKAAEQGYARAQFSLGNSYITGSGIGKDDAKAVEWYRKAAEQGHAEAQYNLGLCYFKGLGVEKDDAKAAEWYQKWAQRAKEKEIPPDQ